MIDVPDRATLPVMATLRDQILQSLTANDTTILDVSHVTEVDLSFVQLVESARDQARAWAKTIKVSAPAQGPLDNLLHRAGLLADPSSDDVDFWFHGVLPQ